ncbi:S1 RNA-binding domain-containing protein [Herbivorax sp. ANBcel31]|uniref:S1 RNA-binding domain-containing protein n=1 Tax=Herbivorax sp. ANBcel31 TaxID=3069754 RepID=UPI0027B073C1|nr:S1 RNA-binding domain-containing protein [Herbivorax sp. ANBcel31]MDQ2086531.1 S1 RNA-binding domain-containing protein [Herbivorax sp. ANBcel31]
MLVEVGKIVDGKVSGITNFGAFVQLSNSQTGLVHISEVAEEYVKDIKTYLKENQTVKVKVISVDNNGRISLSIKKAQESKKPSVKSSKPEEIDWDRQDASKGSFEDRLAKFMKDSDEKMHDLKKSFESKRGGGGYRKSAQH